jgi:MacB-like periplasmic core domain
MVKRSVIVIAMTLAAVTSCERPPEFSPPSNSWTTSQATIEGAAGPRTIARIDSTFFGQNFPMLGRVIMQREYNEGSSVTVLSDAFWTERFERRPDIIGTKLEVDGTVRIIVGIMPPGLDVPEGVAAWIPRNDGTH